MRKLLNRDRRHWKCVPDLLLSVSANNGGTESTDTLVDPNIRVIVANVAWIAYAAVGGQMPAPEDRLVIHVLC